MRREGQVNQSTSVLQQSERRDFSALHLHKAHTVAHIQNTQYTESETSSLAYDKSQNSNIGHNTVVLSSNSSKCRRASTPAERITDPHTSLDDRRSMMRVIRTVIECYARKFIGWCGQSFSLLRLLMRESARLSAVAFASLKSVANTPGAWGTTGA